MSPTAEGPPAPDPGFRRTASGWRWPACRPAALAALAGAVALAGALIWLIALPRVGTDLPAGLTRAGWAGRYPGAGYLFAWYGGLYPVGYSLLAPYLLATFGTRASMAAATVLSASLMGWLLARHRVPRARAAAVWAAVALCTELTAGRASFTVALPAAFGCVLAAGTRPRAGSRWRARVKTAAVVMLALLTSMLSPVAGLFLAVAATALVVCGHRRQGLYMGLAATVPLSITLAIPGTGRQPIGIQDLLLPLVAVAAVLADVPRHWRVIRAGAAIYAVGTLAAWLLPTAVGANADRLGELLAGPVLIGLAEPGRLLPAGLTATRRALSLLALAGAAAWLAAQPTQDLAHGNAPAYEPQTAALVRELRALHADTARVEAVPQYGHWESYELAGTVPLARGWERQLDTARNPLFYSGTLTPAAYHAWLAFNAVRYVAISEAVPDSAARAETRLIRAGQPWLVPVWHDSYWRLYQVTGTLAIASPPASITAYTPAMITLRMPRAGTALIRVHWSPQLGASGGAAVRRSGTWTTVTARRPGTYQLTAPY